MGYATSSGGVVLRGRGVPRHHAGHSAASPRTLAGRCGRAARPAHRRSTGCSWRPRVAEWREHGGRGSARTQRRVFVDGLSHPARRHPRRHPRRSGAARRSRHGARAPALLRGCRDRGRPVRRRDVRGGWGHCADPGAAHRGGLRPHVRHPVDRRRLPRRHRPTGDHRSRPGTCPADPRPHLGPSAAVVGTGQHRRVRGHPFRRSGIDRLRPQR